jgi:hypothetical protein
VAEVAVIRWAILLTLLLFAAPVAAQEAPPVEPPPPGDVDVPPGEDVIVIATRGIVAPFSGQLFDPATATRWGNRIVRYRMQIRLLTDELRTCHEEHEASTDTQLRIVEESYQREVDGLRTDLREQAARYEGELARHRSPPFYETWSFGFAMGVVVTGVVAGLIAGLVGAIP